MITTCSYSSNRKGDKMIGQKIKKTMLVALLFGLLSTFFMPVSAFAYNKSWDQGHKVCVVEPGTNNWGKFDDNGVFHGRYTSKECCQLLCKVCPVYGNTGQLQKTFTDLTIPGTGPILSITRTYNSQDWATGLFGNGWTFNFGRRLIITRDNDGTKRIGVLLKTGEKNYYIEGLDGSLTRLTDYGAQYELFKKPDNSYLLKNINGVVYELREDGKISKIIDKNKNEMVFSYNSVGCIRRITNTSGNYLDFQLGPNGKIASISDNFGRSIAYQYDIKGNLISVTDPLGNKSQYVYNNQNLLSQIIDARGNTIETVNYDNNLPPRVSTFTERGEAYTIAYFDGKTEKTDSKGNKWIYYFNDVGIIEKVITPLGDVEQRQFNKINATSMDWKDDLNGNRTSYTYDLYGNIVTKTDPLGNIWNYSYVTGTDLLKSVIDPSGVVTEYRYDDEGNLIEIVKDANGELKNTTSYTYDDSGNQTSITDPLGRATLFEYDSNSNLIKMQDSVGNITNYKYDDRGNKLSETNSLGYTTTYSYDLMDHLVSMTDALNYTTTYKYDANGNLISVTDANGNTETYVYDTYNRLIQKSDPIGNKETFVYDSKDNLIRKVDANGNQTTFEYDSLNRKIRETDALGKSKLYTYDAVGNKLSITDQNGNKNTFEYNENNQIKTKQNAAGEVINFEYDNKGNLTLQSYLNGPTIIKEYNSLNKVTQIKDDLGILKSFSYDAIGRVISETDSLGNITQYSYNTNNQVITIVDSLGNSEHRSYDSLGNLLETTDRQGNKVTYAYDALGRKVSKTDQLGNVTRYTYGQTNNNILSVTDADLNTISYKYDESNRLIQILYPDGTSKNYTYNSAGKVTTVLDQNGNNTIYTYNQLNQITKINYSDNQYVEYTYDGRGNLLTAITNNTAVSFTYDSLNRIIQSIQNGNIVNYNYDFDNKTKQIVYPNGKVINEIWDSRNRLIRIEDGTSELIAEYTYDNSDKLSSVRYSNGAIASIKRNPNGLINYMSYVKENTLFSSTEYGYDNENNRIYKKDLIKPNSSQQYNYDKKYQLTIFKSGQLTNRVISNPIFSQQIIYDPVGNMNNITQNQITQNRTHNQLNQIASIDSINYSYDLNGNLKNDGEKEYSYDSENRLISVKRISDGQRIVDYQYDGLGRRITKTTYLPQLKTTQFIYRDMGFQVIAELSSNGSIEKAFVWGADLSGKMGHLGGIGGLIELNDLLNGKDYLYLYDANGNVKMLMDKNSDEISATYQYTGFGDILNMDGSIDDKINPYRFSTKYFDSDIQMYYYGYRYYNPKAGRWLNQDPIEEMGGLLDLKVKTFREISGSFIEWNHPYLFVSNNPINKVDLFGLLTWDSCKQKTQPSSNGCGPEDPDWLNWLVPEGFFPSLGGYNFGPACDVHDICYGTCCSNKSTCDYNFLTGMKRQCDKWVDRLYGPGGIFSMIGPGRLKEIDRGSCYLDANTFYTAVAQFGDDAYLSAQNAACICPPRQ